MSEVRKAFLNAKLSSETISVPLDGKDVKVEMREKTVKQQFDLLDKARTKDGEIDDELLTIESIIATAFDPDTGEPVFEAADRDAIKGLPARAFNVLMKAANDAAGLGSEDEVVADLDEAPAAATSSG